MWKDGRLPSLSHSHIANPLSVPACQHLWKVLKVKKVLVFSAARSEDILEQRVLLLPPFLLQTMKKSEEGRGLAWVGLCTSVQCLSETLGGEYIKLITAARDGRRRGTMRRCDAVSTRDLEAGSPSSELRLQSYHATNSISSKRGKSGRLCRTKYYTTIPQSLVIKRLVAARRPLAGHYY